MARLNMNQIVMAVALTAVIIQGISADDHVVGGNAGWTNTANIDYTGELAKERIEVNDTLTFNFANRAHDVAEVTKDAYDACTTTNPIILLTTPPVTIRLNSTGSRYFICTIGAHCRNGQKVAVTVVADDAPPAPTTSTTSSPSTPGGNSAAAPAVGFSFALVSLAVAFFSF